MKGTGATSATRGTRGTGRSEGVVGVSPTGIELGLKVGGIGQLGISTDYGGGIVIEIFGQKIVWGREGGKIHYNLGGLEVIVEARDCVIVETRKIFGQITGRHVYPDPGCKLPPEPDPRSESDPIQQPSSNNPNAILTVKKCVGGRYELVREALSASDYRNRIYAIEDSLARMDAFDESEYNKASEDAFANNYHGAGNWYIVQRSVTNQRIYGGQWLWLSDANSNYLGSLGRTFKVDALCSRSFVYDLYLVKGATVENTGSRWFTSARYGIKSIIDSATPSPPCQEPPKIILPPAGNQPPMLDSCCEALSADIADIKEVLATKEILAGKMTFPWKWRMPGGEGEEIIMDYPNLMRAIAQMIDHLSIHPPKLTIKDINNAIADDQSFSNQFPSATQAFEALMAQVWDANADVDTLTNFLYRLAWLSVQQSFNLAQVTGTVETLKDMLGGETESMETTLTTPFNIAAGTGAKKMPPGKGFGKRANESGIDNRIEANTEMATEAMLSEFLKVRDNPIMIDTFSGKRDVMDMLLLILAALEKLTSR